MIPLKRGANKVELSHTSSFTPLIKFNKLYTGNIQLCKESKRASPREATIEAQKDQILDLGAYREYFTMYRDTYNKLTVTVNAPATLEYEPVEDLPVESTIGKKLEFTVKQDPNYVPPDIGTEKCPICQEEVSKNDLMGHIQKAHM